MNTMRYLVLRLTCNWLLMMILGMVACTSTTSPIETVTPTGTAVSTATASPTETILPPEPTATPESDALIPSFGNWHDMIFHDVAGQVVLVNGGPETGKPGTDPLELWGWDGATWSLLSNDPAGPRWRNFASVAYDSDRQVLVLYGGLQSETEQFVDTWEWDGITWTQHLSEGPGLRESAGMAYDAARGEVVLFGGAQSGEMMNDTWTWDGEQWQPVATTGPSARFPAGFAYDAAQGHLLLFGGHAVGPSSFITFGDTWMWDGVMWHQLTDTGPAARDGARMVFDPQAKRMVLFGGVQLTTSVEYLSDTWLWDGAQWQQGEGTSPPGRVHPAMALDAIRGKIVLAGGSNAPGVKLSDVWEWDGQQWSCVSTCG